MIDVSAVIWGVAGGAVLLALVGAGVSLFVTLRTSSPAGVERQLSQLRLELTDVIDRVEQWQKRDRVRRLREGKEAADPVESLPQLTPEQARDQRIAVLRSKRRSP